MVTGDTLIKHVKSIGNFVNAIVSLECFLSRIPPKYRMVATSFSDPFHNDTLVATVAINPRC